MKTSKYFILLPAFTLKLKSNFLRWEQGIHKCAPELDCFECNKGERRELVMTLDDIELGRCTILHTVVHQLQDYWVVDGKLENIYKYNFIQFS